MGKFPQFDTERPVGAGSRLAGEALHVLGLVEVDLAAGKGTRCPRPAGAVQLVRPPLPADKVGAPGALAKANGGGGEVLAIPAVGSVASTTRLGALIPHLPRRSWVQRGFPPMIFVVVMHGDNLSYAETFEAALEGLFDDTPGEATRVQTQIAHGPESLSERARRANEVFERYVRLQGEGRFSEAGLELERLQSLLQSIASRDETEDSERTP